MCFVILDRPKPEQKMVYKVVRRKNLHGPHYRTDQPDYREFVTRRTDHKGYVPGRVVERNSGPTAVPGDALYGNTRVARSGIYVYLHRHHAVDWIENKFDGSAHYCVLMLQVDPADHLFSGVENGTEYLGGFRSVATYDKVRVIGPVELAIPRYIPCR